MPTYNDSKYIKRSLDSIMKQKYENYEVLICNDGSTDDTEKVIKEYIKKYDKNGIVAGEGPPWKVHNMRYAHLAQ